MKRPLLPFVFHLRQETITAIDKEAKRRGVPSVRFLRQEIERLARGYKKKPK